MRINNVSASTSCQNVVMMTIITVVVTSLLVFAYVTTTMTPLSVPGYFSWLWDLFQTMRMEMSDEPVLPWTIFILFWCMYIGFFVSIFSLYQAKTKFNKGHNVKYINLLPDRIEVCYNRADQRFVCGYSDVENLDIDIQSTLVHTKHGSQIVFQQMNLMFGLADNKKIKLSATTLTPMKLIYKIIDFTRGVKNFKYSFSGYGEIADYKEKIDKYLHFAYKDVVGRKAESNLKLLSLLFFGMGIFFVVTFKDIFLHLNRFWDFMMISPFAVFFIISFVFDVILVVDKIRDNTMGGQNGQ